MRVKGGRKNLREGQAEVIVNEGTRRKSPFERSKNAGNVASSGRNEEISCSVTGRSLGNHKKKAWKEPDGATVGQ